MFTDINRGIHHKKYQQIEPFHTVILASKSTQPIEQQQTSTPSKSTQPIETPSKSSQPIETLSKSTQPIETLSKSTQPIEQPEEKLSDAQKIALYNTYKIDYYNQNVKRYIPVDPTEGY